MEVVSNSFLKLIKACFSRLSLYPAVLPYNLNWMRRDYFWIGEFLSNNPISIVDIGARDGSLEELEPLYPYISYIGFDADSSAAKQFKNPSYQCFKNFEVYPYFIGKTKGPQSFNLYKNRGESSQLFPNTNYVNSFSPNFGIDKTIMVEGTTLNQFMIDKDDLDVDVIKLDTQGTEFDILINGDKAISKALLIESEVEFIEIYKNQKLFHDICGYLYERNYMLLYLNRVFVNRNKFIGLSRGQMVFGDALFGLNETGIARLSVNKKKKYCVLLINYGLIDYAYDIYSSDLELQDNSHDLRTFFSNYKIRSSLIARWKRIIYMQVEKFVAIILYLRKTNQLNFESDRSWPIR